PLIPYTTLFRSVLVVEQLPALPQVLVVGVDARADVARGVGPLAGLHVEAFPDQSDRRAAAIGLDQGALGLLVVHRLAGQARERSVFQDEGAGLRGIALGAAGLAGAQVDEHVGQAG